MQPIETLCHPGSLAALHMPDHMPVQALGFPQYIHLSDSFFGVILSQVQGACFDHSLDEIDRLGLCYDHDPDLLRLAPHTSSSQLDALADGLVAVEDILFEVYGFQDYRSSSLFQREQYTKPAGLSALAAMGIPVFQMAGGADASSLDLLHATLFQDQLVGRP
jgi:hypothetical protein